MKFYQETTKWSTAVANGIYLLNDSKTKVYAFVAAGQKSAKVFKGPLSIDTRGRTFVAVNGRYGVDLKEDKPVTGNLQWSIVGSKGDRYTVEKTDNGFVCSCSGFKFRGNCRHVKEVEAKNGT
jgi:hypothetical protein